MVDFSFIVSLYVSDLLNVTIRVPYGTVLESRPAGGVSYEWRHSAATPYSVLGVNRTKSYDLHPTGRRTGWYGHTE